MRFGGKEDEVNSIERKIIDAHLVAVQAAAERVSASFDKLSRLARDARHGLTESDVERFRAKIVDMAPLSADINRQIAACDYAAKSWTASAHDLVGEQETMLLQSRTEQAFDAIAKSLETAIAGAEPESTFGFTS